MYWASEQGRERASSAGMFVLSSGGTATPTEWGQCRSDKITGAAKSQLITEKALTHIYGVLLALRALLLSLLLLNLLGTGVAGVYGGHDGQVEPGLSGCAGSRNALPQVVDLLCRRRIVILCKKYAYIMQRV
jgi:hypothetical protein